MKVTKNKDYFTKTSKYEVIIYNVTTDQVHGVINFKGKSLLAMWGLEGKNKMVVEPDGDIDRSGQLDLIEKPIKGVYK